MAFCKTSLVIDVSALLGLDLTLRDVRALLELGDSPIERVGEALASDIAAPCRTACPWCGCALPSSSRRPCATSSAMRGTPAGKARVNLHEAWYRLPIFYFSNTLRIFGPEDEVPIPSATDRLDYEMELGCVIGREGSDIADADALDYIAGFCIFNDFQRPRFAV